MAHALDDAALLRQKRREQNQEAKQKQSILKWHFTSVSNDGVRK